MTVEIECLVAFKKNVGGSEMELRKRSSRALYIKAVVSGLLIPIFVVLILSCQTVPDPEPPPEDVKKEDREKVFKDYRLSKRGSTFFGVSFLQGDNPQGYGAGQVAKLFELSDEEANSAYKSGWSWSIASSVTAGFGGACLGWPLGKSLAGNELETVDYVLIIAGGGLVVTSIIFSFVADGALDRAVKRYNTHLKDGLSD